MPLQVCGQSWRPPSEFMWKNSSTLGNDYDCVKHSSFTHTHTHRCTHTHAHAHMHAHIRTHTHNEEKSFKVWCRALIQHHSERSDITPKYAFMHHSRPILQRAVSIMIMPARPTKEYRGQAVIHPSLATIDLEINTICIFAQKLMLRILQLHLPLLLWLLHRCLWSLEQFNICVDHPLRMKGAQARAQLAVSVRRIL